MNILVLFLVLEKNLSLSMMLAVSFSWVLFMLKELGLDFFFWVPLFLKKKLKWHVKIGVFRHKSIFMASLENSNNKNNNMRKDSQKVGLASNDQEPCAPWGVLFTLEGMNSSPLNITMEPGCLHLWRHNPHPYHYHTHHVKTQLV